MKCLTATSVVVILFFASGCHGQTDSSAAPPNESRTPASSDVAPRTADDLEQHLAELNDRLPTDEKFYVVVSKPFVVIGHGSAEQVERWASQTVRWAVERIKTAYFERDPVRIIDIWLFNDRDSYERYNEQLFGGKPSTPFGYYSPTHRALVMNIATGGGTLVHEIVHPFVEANFPDCPSWFNEGLASLYEQSAERDGQVVGLTNWRLAGLQTAIQGDSLPTFEQLCSTTTDEFYTGSGINYAQARYLCYYLQENNLLRKYYQQFRDNCDEDPTGYSTLKSVLDVEDMSQFEADWKRYVLRLRFER